MRATLRPKYIKYKSDNNGDKKKKKKKDNKSMLMTQLWLGLLQVVKYLIYMFDWINFLYKRHISFIGKGSV